MNRALPKRCFPLQNLKLEQTRLFHIESPLRKGGIVILAGMRDSGEAGSLIPPLRYLSQDPNVRDIFIAADSRAQEALSASGMILKRPRSLNPLRMISDIGRRANVIITGFSAMPGAELALTKNARYDGIPSIHILTPDILALSEAGAGCPVPKEVTDGASIGIFSPEEMVTALRNILSNPGYLQQLKTNMAHFAPQDGATKRVANLVLQIAKNHRRNCK